MPKGVYIRTEKLKLKLSRDRKKTWADPNSKYNTIKYKQNNKNTHRTLEFRKNASKKAIIRWTDPNERRRQSNIKKKQWKDCIYNRQKFSETISKRNKKLWKNPNSIYNSKKYRNKLSKSKSGKNHYLYGEHQSKESIKKIIKSTSGKKNHFYGKHHTEESNLKNRNAAKRRWADPNSAYNTLEYRAYRKTAMIYATKFIKFNDTKIEKIVRKILKKNHIYFKPQKWIGKYRVDFFIPSCNLCIESLGTWSHGDPRIYNSDDIIQGHRKAKDKWVYDKNRDKFLISKGYKIIKFWEKEINKEPNVVEELIKNAIIQNS